MPWTDDNPPDVAKNWTPDEQHKCVAAANAVLERENWEQSSDDEKKEIERGAIMACVNAAGKSKAGGEKPSNAYLDKFRQMLLDSGYFLDDQIRDIMRVARSHAGGKARADNLRKQEMAYVGSLTNAKVKEMADVDLLRMHRQLHWLWKGSKKIEQGGLSKAHRSVVSEMSRRNMKHSEKDDLDKVTAKAMEPVPKVSRPGARFKEV